MGEFFNINNFHKYNTCSDITNDSFCWVSTWYVGEIGYLSFTKDHIKHDLLQTQVLVLQLNFVNY